MRSLTAAADPTSGSPQFLERIKRMLRALGSKNANEPGRSKSDLLERLGNVAAERGRLSALIEAEEERQRALLEQLQKTEAARIEALTAARVNGDEATQQRADQLFREAADLRRQTDDCSVVAKNLTVRREEVRSEFASLLLAYRHAVAAHLDRVYEALIDKYNELAPEIAETILHIAAVRRVMMKNGVANTNGWSGAVLLPGMRARVGAYVPPILDGGSDGFAGAADARVTVVLEDLKAAGFEYGTGEAR